LKWEGAKPHDRLGRAKDAVSEEVEALAGFAFGGLLRLGASSTKVHACLWNWHITQATASGEMTQRLFLLRQPSHGRSGRMLGPRGLGALVGVVMALTLPDTLPVAESIREGGMVESMIID
jgi:hypothetical protein